jgi:hypothetical protein
MTYVRELAAASDRPKGMFRRFEPYDVGSRSADRDHFADVAPPALAMAKLYRRWSTWPDGAGGKITG